MPSKKTQKKVTLVHAHKLHVPVSPKNPTGITIRDEHLRRLEGTYLDKKSIKSTIENYNIKNLTYPGTAELGPRSDKYDKLIAIWTDYFNKKFSGEPSLDPNMIKALISSESDFRENPSENKKAIGIIQITPQTLKILQDPNGESKDFIFHRISKKDLLDPGISIPMGVRWLHLKRKQAEQKLQRPAINEDIIIEYKGLTKSSSQYKENALKKYREAYVKLKK